ncbi:MAG: Do family serine endopeptidase [Flavobacteriales bacterium]|nr:Do family serine endopeptidase [Flavobacteriales bacterium]
MIKKITPYLIVGVVSALVTIFVFEHYNKKEQQGEYFQWSKNENNSNQKATYSFANNPSSAPDFVDAAEKSVNAVVSIKNYGNKVTQKMDPFFEDFFDFGFPQFKRKSDDSMPSGAGSGVLISDDGYIITNNHVIDGATKLEVVLNNQKTYVAEVIGKDASTDIALIKIDAKELPYLSFSNSDNVRVGEWVLAIGNPFGLNSTVTAGIVSAEGRSLNLLKTKGNAPIESFIQTDAAINPGNSGGALVNTSGNLIGINTAISSQTGSYVGYGFAVPSNLAKKIVEDIRRFGIVQRGFLGVNTLDLSDDAQILSYNQKFNSKLKLQEGVMVTGLSENGGALDAGIEQNDIITEVNGEKIKSFADLSFSIGSKRPGDVVNVKVVRDGKEKSYNVTLKDAKGNTKVKSKSDLTALEKLGANFEPLTDKQKVNYGIQSGVLVTNVSEGKLQSLGISDDFIILKVNGKNVNSSEDVEKVLKNYDGTVSLEYIDPYGRLIRRGFILN